jgi:hypothetical protein
MVAAERARLTGAVRELGLQVTPSQANVLWLRAEGAGGGELARRLERHGIIVAPGGPLGDDARVRVSIQRPEASLASALVGQLCRS